MEYKHVPVLLNEVISNLDIKENGVYVDATLGRGGYTKVILSKVGSSGKVIGFDLDETAIKEVSNNFKEEIDKKLFLIHGNFKNLKVELERLGFHKVDGIVYDLGVSSPQFDDPTRGFSYRFDGKLDMRMDSNSSLTAKEIVNSYSLHDLTKIFKEYGEEKDSYRIASNIVKSREQKPIETTFELVEIIKKSKSMKDLSKQGHPAKQVFQALRIEVNQELINLEASLKDALKMLKKNGRVAVVTFHSLEDRIVKNTFKSVSCSVGDRKNSWVKNNEEIKYHLVNSKVITPSEKEITCNPRAKSAKLRVIEYGGEI